MKVPLRRLKAVSEIKDEEPVDQRKIKVESVDRREGLGPKVLDHQMKVTLLENESSVGV